jgi:Spy/CpxP family protein refolding chaperone
MKTTFASFILISALSGVLFAQTPDSAPPPPPHHDANPQQQINRLTKKLALTADQQSQILPILQNRDQQVSAIYNDATLSQKDRHARLSAVRNDAQSQLRNVLTDTQRAAYDQMEQEARERAKAKRQTGVSN